MTSSYFRFCKESLQLIVREPCEEPREKIPGTVLRLSKDVRAEGVGTAMAEPERARMPEKDTLPAEGCPPGVAA
jgi:hypothetical protein